MILQHGQIRSHTRQMTRAVLVLVTLLTLPILAIAQEFSDPRLAEFPSVASVYENIKGRDELETATKQAAVFLILRESSRDGAPNRYNLSGEHLQLFQLYQAEFKTIFDRAQAEYSNDHDKWLEFYRGHTSLGRDPEFLLEMYQAIWPTVAANYAETLDAQSSAETKEIIFQLAIAAVAIFLGLLVLRMIARDFSSSKMVGDRNLVVRGKRYKLYKVTGDVIEFNKKMETVVSGGGGGGGNIQAGTGYVSSTPVHITSQTYVHDYIVLQGVDGQKHSLQLMDFDINTTKDNTMTIVWAIKKGKDRGPHFYAYDHDTRSPFLGGSALSDMHKPSWIWNIISVFVATGVLLLVFDLIEPQGSGSGGAFFAFMILVPLVSYFMANGLRKNVGEAKARKLTQSSEFSDFIMQDV